MVCLAADDLAERLVRTAWQTAASLGVEWVAVHIQTPRDNRANPTEKQVLERSLSLAAAQGAQVVALSGEDVGTELLTYAHAHNITNIVVGKHLSRPWRRVLHGALADELVRGSDGIHVLLVTSEEQSANVRLWDIELGRHPVRGYLGSVGAVVAATLVGLAVRPFLAPTNIALVYLLAVVLSATFWGMGPAIFSAVAAVVTFDILFVPPYGTLAVHDSQYFLTFVIFLIVGILISELGSRLRAQVDAARQRERETAALYALSTSMTRDTSSSLDAALQQLNSLFDAQAVLLRAESGETLTAYPPTNLPEIEKQAARWAFEHNEAAGHGTLNLAGAERLYLPLQSAQRMLGVLSVRPEARQRGVQSQRLLETFAGQVAIALEHARLSEQAEQARLLEASERFRNALLSSLSHDLRTPLASILGAATGLLDETAQLSPATRRDLVETIHEEARRLNRYVGNLLNMTRLESGTLKPQREWHSIEEVIGSALAHAGLNGHPVRLEIDPALPLIPFDFVLIDQVLVNLLDNAAKFSPASAPIEITAEVQAQTLEVTVSDRGTTVPRTELDRIFEKFYRVSQGQRTVGMGLGLSIAKGIVEAHDGTVFARPRAAGGMEIGFRLPARVQVTAVCVKARWCSS
jgi:two-component system sensor histidine kinase KdpD